MNDLQVVLAKNINQLLDLVNCPLDTERLEECLGAIELESHSFSSFIEALLNSPVWQGWEIEGKPYKKMILDVGAYIDHLALLNGEPAYHSRRHFIDVCFMISYLLMQQELLIAHSEMYKKWFASQEERWLLLLAAVAHDLGHSGLMNTFPYELEIQSLNLLHQFLLKAGFEGLQVEAVLGVIRPWILATDHADYPSLMLQLSSELIDHDKCMAMLLVEADLASSALPHRGALLAQRLAEEWKSSYPQKSIALANNVGYLQFLNGLRFLSPQAESANIPKILQTSLVQLRSSLS